MKALLLLAALIFSLEAFADKNRCLKKLTYNFEVDSRVFKTNTDLIDTSDIHENDHLALGVSYIRHTLSEQGCNPKADVNFSRGPLGATKSSCKKVIDDREFSLSCYIETDLGYFFITKDLQTNAFIIFSRWD